MTPAELIVDSFAGGGGASLGISWALGRSPDIAINHDKEAIALHAANHPDSLHLAEDVWKVDPVEACNGRPVGLMWLSPDCKHFSKAKGGKPVSKKIRGLAWVAVRWAAAVRPRVIVLENVEEFQTWGPVLRDSGMPCKERRGQTFRAFVSRLRKLGYVVEWRELRACDYGAPTIRKRFFLVARCDGQQIAWPTPTHGKGRALPWRTAAECIDWAIPCHSIFLTKEEARAVGVRRPLAPATMRRIARGIKKFVLDNPHPFIVGVGGRQGQSPERSVEQPLQTITAKADSAIVVPSLVTYYGGETAGAERIADLEEPLRTQGTENRFGLVTPYLVPMQHENSPTSVEDPLQTITTQGNKFNVVSPYLVRTAHGDQDASGKRRGKGEHSLGEPLPTVLASGDFGLVSPFLVPRYGEREGQQPRSASVEQPLPTIVPTQNGAQLVATFLAKHYGGHETPGSQLDMPLGTVTTQDHNHLVTAHIAKHYGDRIGSSLDEPLHTVVADGVHHALIASHIKRDFGTSTGAAIDSPLPTITSDGGGHASLVASFLMAYYGTQQRTGNLSEPMPAVTSKDRFALVTVDSVEYVIADIGMRMLMPRELYRAQGFPDSYRIDIPFNGKPLTKTAQVRMVGNSVPPEVACAILKSVFRAESEPAEVAA